MTVDEVIVQLRDIHLPPEANEGLGLEFAIWPLAVLEPSASRCLC